VLCTIRRGRGWQIILTRAKVPMFVNRPLLRGPEEGQHSGAMIGTWWGRLAHTTRSRAYSRTQSGVGSVSKQLPDLNISTPFALSVLQGSAENLALLNNCCVSTRTTHFSCIGSPSAVPRCTPRTGQFGRDWGQQQGGGNPMSRKAWVAACCFGDTFWVSDVLPSMRGAPCPSSARGRGEGTQTHRRVLALVELAPGVVVQVPILHRNRVVHADRDFRARVP